MSLYFAEICIHLRRKDKVNKKKEYLIFMILVGFLFIITFPMLRLQSFDNCINVILNGLNKTIFL